MSAEGLPAVLQVTSSAERRGAEVFASDLHTELSGRGWPVTTVALVPGDRQPRLAFEALGTRPYAPATIAALRRLARANAVVVAHGSTTMAATLAATLLPRRPWIYRSIGDPGYWQAHPVTRGRVRLQLSTAERIVVLWDAAADRLVAGGVARRRIVVIPNGVPAARFPLVDVHAATVARTALDPGGGIGGRIVAFIGSISNEKGLDVAIDAVGRLPDVTLVVAGDGPLRSALTERADRVAPGRVRFLGLTANPGVVLAAADVVVVPSRTEGMAAVLIEAGLSGVAVVATDVGAVREVVLPGATGVLVPPGDPVRLAEGLLQALEGGLGGAEARSRCMRLFDMPVVADAWADLLLAAGRR